MNTRVTNLTGRQGGTFIADTTTVTPPSGESFHALLVVEEAVLSAISSNITNDQQLIGKTLPAGFVLYGLITSVKLTSGSAIAYVA